TVTTFGWRTCAAARASRKNRSWSRRARTPFPGIGHTLTATRRPRNAAMATYTTPFPPLPIGRTSSYRATHDPAGKYRRLMPAPRFDPRATIHRDCDKPLKPPSCPTPDGRRLAFLIPHRDGVGNGRLRIFVAR